MIKIKKKSLKMDLEKRKRKILVRYSNYLKMNKWNNRIMNWWLNFNIGNGKWKIITKTLKTMKKKK